MKKIKFTIAFLTFSLFATKAMAQDQKVEVVVQAGHYARINDVKYSHNDNLLATASADKTIKLWRARDGKEIRTFSGSSSSILEVTFNATDMLILGVNISGNIMIWEVETGTLKRTFKPDEDKFTCASFHPEKNLIITGTEKSHVICLDFETGEQISVYKAIPGDIGYSGNFEYKATKTIMYSNNGKYIIAGKEDKTAIVWDAEKGNQIRKYKQTRYTCSGCAASALISNDNKYIFSAYSDSVKMFDFKTGNLIREFSNRKGNLGKLAISHDDKYIGVEQYGNVNVWNINTGKLVNTFSEKSKRITSLAFSPDGDKIITGNEKRMADVRLVDSGKKLFTLKGYLNNVDEKILSHSYMYWAALVNETKLSPDGRYIAVGRSGNNVKLMNFNTGRIEKILKGHSGMVICLDFSDDGKFLATGGIDGKAILWDMENLEPKHIYRYRDSTLAIFSIDIGPDNKNVATADWAGYVVLWDIHSGEYVKSLKPHEGHASYRARFSPNGLYIISAGLDRKMKLIEIDTGEEIRTFTGHTEVVSSINVHPFEDKILTSSWDNTIREWDFYSGLQTKKIVAHQGGTYCAKYDSTGNYIISGGNDNLVKVWDAKTGALLSKFEGHRGAVGEVNVSNNGKYIVSGGRDGNIKIWNVKETKEIASIIFLKDNDWFISNRAGYFDASEGALSEISFVKGTKLFEVERFFDGFYTPGLYKKAVFEETGEFRQNVFNQVDKSPPPTVEIVAPEPGEMDNANAIFLVKITNNGGGVSELKVMHNGKRLSIDDSELDRMKRKGQYTIKSFDAILIPGKNEFTISAMSDAMIESEKAIINISLQGTPKNADCYVMCIGINKYENPSLNLYYARSDAEAFSKLIDQKGKNLFNGIEVYELFDKNASKDNIMNQLESIGKIIRPEDVFIFFYAGHGSMVDNNFYFMTAESTGLYQKDKLTSAISAPQLQEKLKTIKALKQVLLIDACHSGTSLDVLAMRGANEEKALAQLSRSSGIHVMASSESQQQAAEVKSLGHGVFTYVLLQALQGKADGAPKDSKITIYELKSYVDDQVPEISYRLIRHKQFPSTFSIGHDFPLVLE